MTFDRFLQLMRRNWFIIATCGFVGSILGLSLYGLLPATYETRGQLAVSIDNAASLSDLSAGSTYLDMTVPTFAATGTTSQILEPVAQRLGGLAVADIAGRLSVDREGKTNIITVTASWNTPDGAVRLANEVTSELAKTLSATGPEIGGSPNQYRIVARQVTRAVPPPSPSSPSRLAFLVGTVAIGLGAGLLIATARDSRDSFLKADGNLANESPRGDENGYRV